jgi:hypothetical protein
MKGMTGIILIIFGAISLIFGVIIFLSSKKSENSASKINNLDNVIKMALADGVLTTNERNVIKNLANDQGLKYDVFIKEIENQLADLESDLVETELINYNKKNGDDFEKFVIQKFAKKNYKIKEWAGDKYINGIYAETTLHPDFLVEFNFNNKSAEFFVECKWRHNYYKRGVEFATPGQFKRYKNFEKQREIPVFIAIGIGGKGNNPEKIYILPLNKVKSNFIPLDILNRFNIQIDKDFNYDIETKELK